MSRDAASRAQIEAADPATSTWLSANAGSGKTRVLIDRVARLLLDEVPPQKILCLTYTKAAAAEMQNRLFERLGEWSMLEDSALVAALSELGLPEADARAHATGRARTLFARAIETPGGLKIQTIHSFCASVLRRFPLEAGVSPAFTEMTDRDRKRLIEEVLDDIALGPDSGLLGELVTAFSESKVAGLAAEIVGARDRFEDQVTRAALQDALRAPKDLDEDELLSRVVTDGDIALLRRVAEGLDPSKASESRLLEKISPLLSGLPDPDWLEVLEQAFLTASEPIVSKAGKLPTKATRAALGPDAAALDDLMDRVEAARETRLALAAVRDADLLHRFAEALLPRVAASKQARGWLDFDDQILMTRKLLSESSLAQWVLFRLDGGIDHILVDEAQDTSPEQWDVVQRLAEEFSSGRGARDDVRRTIFVVGDKKQSIYSFQGADPEGFDRMRAHFKGRLEASQASFLDTSLLYSFRSSATILTLVDQAFASAPLGSSRDSSEHLPFFDAMPGRVDLWPALAKTEPGDGGPWQDPIDQPATDDAKLELARRVASEIKTMLERGATIEDAKGNIRRVQPGDFLVLVQRRSEIFREIIRACKEEGLPTAGKDRMGVAENLAVRDVLSLLEFCALPENNLALAEALRSPLLGWSEADLFGVAHHRSGPHLWPAVREFCAHEKTETLTILSDLLDQADFLRPYELIERLLVRHGGRTRLIARLGAEAQDGLDALLAQALDYEGRESPSLTGFLTWLARDEDQVKRQLDGRTNEIRVMTVHGAKGLESPIVILPDCAKARRPNPNHLVYLEDGTPVLQRAARLACAAVAEAKAADLRKIEEERLRLLYVAMTRAESWLIVAAAGDTGEGLDSWHAILDSTMRTHAAAAQLETPTGPGLRVENGVWPALDPGPLATSEPTPPEADHLPKDQPAPEPPPAPVSPSDLGGDKILFAPGYAGLPEEEAKHRGTLVHLLLEKIAEPLTADWADRAAALVAAADPGCPAALATDAIEEAGRVLASPALAAAFAPGTLAEVPIAARLPSLSDAPVLGTIDRLLIAPDRVTAIDFKTNAVVPERPEDTPEGILRQMGAYGEALSLIYPDRRVETAIIWTRTASYMSLSHELVRDALSRAGSA